jgi:hypothetical protein
MNSVVDAARKRLEARTGVAAPSGGGKVHAGMPAGGSIVAPVYEGIYPAVKPVRSLPRDGCVRVQLIGGLLRPGSGGRGGANMEVVLQREDGQWVEAINGFAIRYNKRVHVGRVVGSDTASDGSERVKLDITILDDSWVKGGYAEYEVVIPGGGRTNSTYSGHCHLQPLNGAALLGYYERIGRNHGKSVRAIEPNEHPRLIFRREHLPFLRQRAQTDFGRRILRILRDRVASGQVKDLTHPVVNTDWQTGAYNTIAQGFLAELYDDAGHRRRAGRNLYGHIRTLPYAGEHGEVLFNGSIQIHQYVHDMGFAGLTTNEAADVVATSSLFYDILSPNRGTMGDLSGYGVNAVVGHTVLTLLRDTGPFRYGEPSAVRSLNVVPPESRQPDEGLAVNSVGAVPVLEKWLLCGPVEVADGSTNPLDSIGGLAGIRPKPGLTLSCNGTNHVFGAIAPSAVKALEGFAGKNRIITIPGAGERSRSWLACRLSVEKRGAYVADLSVPLGYRYAEMWINGTRVENRSIIVLDPGDYRVVIEVSGRVVSPSLVTTDENAARIAWRQYEYLSRDWVQARRLHEATGEMSQMRTLLWMTRGGVRAVYGELAPKIAAGENVVLDVFWPLMSSYAVVLGEPIYADMDTVWQTGSLFGGARTRDWERGNMVFLMPVLSAPERLKVTEAFRRTYWPGNLGSLTSLQLVAAYCYYPDSELAALKSTP